MDFGALADRVDERSPRLVVSAVDVRSGELRAFDSAREPISVEMILASAAIPTLFRAVHLGGGAYWDGLFSQNPPVGKLVDAGPDELWVIQINPKERDDEPCSARRTSSSSKLGASATSAVVALAFERVWRDGDAEAIAGLLAEDVQVQSSAPFPAVDVRGAAAARAFADEHLGTGIVVDRTRKQMTSERVAWTVRARAARGRPSAAARSRSCATGASRCCDSARPPSASARRARREGHLNVAARLDDQRRGLRHLAPHAGEVAERL